MPLDLAPKEAAAHLDLGVPTIRVGSMLSILGPLWGSYVIHIAVPFFFIVPLAFSGVSRLSSFQDVGTVFQNLHGLGLLCGCNQCCQARQGPASVFGEFHSLAVFP